MNSVRLATSPTPAEEKYDPGVDDVMPPLKPKEVEVPIDEHGNIIREEGKKAHGEGEEVDLTEGVVKPPEEEEDKFGKISSQLSAG